MHEHLELAHFLWEDKSQGQKIKLPQIMDLLHPLYPLHEKVFSSYFKGSGELIDALVLFETAINTILDVLGAPIDEPIITLLPHYLVAVIDHLKS